jgi:hypothetical protein
MQAGRSREIARRAAAAGAAAGLLAAPLSIALAAGAAARAHARKAAGELWATVDLCNTARHPNAIGIRGSMPGNGRARDTMYMRFLVQSLDPTTGKWSYIGRSADSGFVRVGSAALTRQAGRSFEFKPTATTFTLRGMVEFQWHHAGRTTRSVYLPTSAGHKSLAGAEPAGFSAATCALP